MNRESEFKIAVNLPDGGEHVIYMPFKLQEDAHRVSVPNYCLIGSRGSGKSIWLRMDAHMRALSVPGCNLVLIRKSHPELLKNHGIYMHEEMKLLGGYYHSTDKIAYYPNGSKLFLSYVGSEADTMNLLGAEFLGAYFDEISTIPWEFFLKLKSSVRVAGKFQGMGLVAVTRAATNPLGVSAREVKEYFVDKDVDLADNQDYNPDDWGYMQLNMEDNPYQNVMVYRKQFSGLPEHIRKAWLEGEFSDPTQLFNLRRNWTTPSGEVRPYHVVPELDRKWLEAATIYRAYDAGWFPDPSYCLWVAHLGNRYVAFHEQVWFRTGVEDIAYEIKAKESELRGTYERPGPLYGKSPIITFCDPTLDINRDDIYTTKDKFEIAGVPMECSVNNREMVVTVVNNALIEEADYGTPRLQMVAGGVPYLIKTVPLMMADPHNAHKLADHKDDHPTVCLGYFFFSTSSLPRTPVEERAERPWMKHKGQGKWILGNENVREHGR